MRCSRLPFLLCALNLACGAGDATHITPAAGNAQSEVEPLEPTPDDRSDAGGTAPPNSSCGAVCCPGEVSCRGAELLRCNASGSEWASAQLCTSALACDAAAGRCRTPICEAGQQRCNDARAQVEECREGVLWVPVETCATACLCVEGFGRALCREPVCERGERLCRGQRLAACNECQTGFEVVRVCEETQLCDAERGACQ